MSILFLKYIGILYKKESCFYFNLHKIKKYRENHKDKRINKMIICPHKKTAKWIFASISLFNVISVNIFVLFYAT